MQTTAWPCFHVVPMDTSKLGFVGSPRQDLPAVVELFEIQGARVSYPNGKLDITLNIKGSGGAYDFDWFYWLCEVDYIAHKDSCHAYFQLTCADASNVIRSYLDKYLDEGSSPPIGI